jgi:hypothetical protein
MKPALCNIVATAAIGVDWNSGNPVSSTTVLYHCRNFAVLES